MGTNAFLDGRVSVLQANGAADDLVKEWIAHSSSRTTSRYTHFEDSYRQQVASNLRLFPSNGPNPVPITFWVLPALGDSPESR